MAEVEVGGDTPTSQKRDKGRPAPGSEFTSRDYRLVARRFDGHAEPGVDNEDDGGAEDGAADLYARHGGKRLDVDTVGTAVTAVVLAWIAYATTAPLIGMFWPSAPLPSGPIAALDPFRIANTYGLFAVMTPERYEIEFQGSNDGVNWTAYPFRYKPQNVTKAPGIYAPYQPRFDWNLWFASLGSWQQNTWVVRTQELLLENDKDALGLFAGNPFRQAPPKYVRTMLWQYSFSTREEKQTNGVWWTRKLLGSYSPTVERLPDGKFAAVE